MPVWQHRVTAPEVGERLDRLLERHHDGVSRSQIKRWTGKGLVLVDGAPVKAGHPLREGELIQVDVPPAPEVTLVPDPIPLAVVHEDADLIVVDKPAGLAVHPGAGRDRGTLVNALLARGTGLSNLGAPLRPGIVHRLDKGTSGLLVVAKTDAAHRHLVDQLSAREVQRRYWALVWGAPPSETGRIEGALGRSRADRRRMRVVPRGGKPAATRYRRVWTDGVLSVLRLALETGRTHQIRVHLRYDGHPVFADPEYGGRLTRSKRVPQAARDRVRAALGMLDRQALHAAVLGFIHPRSGKHLRFAAPLPEDIQNAARTLDIPAAALRIESDGIDGDRDTGSMEEA